jgi:hypothetical protein
MNTGRRSYWTVRRKFAISFNAWILRAKNYKHVLAGLYENMSFFSF